MTTTQTAAARRVSYQLDTLWDFDYEPTHHELLSLYETAKKNQWNGAVALDWSRPIGKEGPVLNIAMAFGGTGFFERYVKKLHKIYPVDPLLKGLIDEILASEAWELKLLGMQMLIEGLAIAAFNVMHKQTGDPTLRDLLDYVLQDEGRHVNFGYFALKRALPGMEPGKRELLEDFALKACDVMYARDERTGFQSIKRVWEEMGLDADEVWRDGIVNSPTIKAFNRFLFTEVLIPRLQRLGLMSSRVEPRYREIGLVN